ncbi:DNA repair protein RAD51 homolog 4 [Ambystoma mexicanum]|uniref:DNA repair protein RAD51 homolog 4 n=1 Tax=Ambystoma mexicanum TaxID=8296 RepID=UPI0037E89B99
MVILREGLCPGLTAEIISTLKINNIRTVVDLVSSDLEEVARKCCLSYKTMVAMRRVLLAHFSAFPSNGADLYEELKSSTAILSTGNTSLDKLLDSGLYTGEVTEINGSAGSGKTQVCLGVAITAAHTLKQSVLYVDSTGGLTASRLFEMVQSQTEDEEEQVEAMQRIEVVRVFDIFKMLDVLQDLRCSLSQQVSSSLGPVKVVIVDSVCAVVYPLLGGKQADGMALMMQLARELKTLARELSIAVLVSNHVTREGSGVLRPALGRSWWFVPSTRILLEQKKGFQGESTSQRVATITKSPRQPTGLQALLEIGSCGAMDVKSAALEEVS